MSLIMHCEPCGKSFTGPVSYNQHMESDKHKRKVSSLNIFNLNEKKVLNTSEILSPSSLERSRDLFECSICSSSFDSFENFQTHSNSSEHAKRVIENDKMHGENANHISLIIGPSVQLNNAENNSDVIFDKSDTILPEVEMMKSQVSFSSFCNTCKKSFSGPEPYKQHIESANHIKKIELEKKIALGINVATPEFSCAPCQKTFSGIVPYGQHMNSDIHRKKLQSLKLFEKFEVDSGLKVDKTVLEPSPLIKETNSWYCKTCDVVCSGPAPFEQHNKGVAHLKKTLREKGTNDVLCSNHQMCGLNMSKEDIVLPGLIKTNENSHIAKIDESVKVFLPEEEIDFDEQNIKINLNSAETDEVDFDNQDTNNNFKLAENDSDKSELNQITLNACSLTTQEKEYIPENKIEEKSDVYQVCNFCNVKLFNKDEAINHYESLEHFQRRWS